jgi:hypothetical protein
MFIVILLLLGLACGYAVGFPWAVLAFVVPVALTLTASDRSASAVTVGFVVVAIGLLLGFVLSARESARHAT